MPGSFQSSGIGGVPSTMGLPIVRALSENGGEGYPLPYTLRGTTVDSTGAALGDCVLVVLRTADNSVAALGVSDAIGNYRIDASPAIQHKIDAYKAGRGGPDVTCSSVNTLKGTPD